MITIADKQNTNSDFLIDKSTFSKTMKISNFSNIIIKKERMLTEPKRNLHPRDVSIG